MYNFQVLKFPKYKDQRLCLYGSTYISVNMICHKENYPTKILFFNSYHMYSWPHIKTLKFRMDSLNLGFTYQNLLYISFHPQRCHMSPPSNVPYLHSSENVWWAVQILQLSSPLLLIQTTVDHSCNSQQSASEYPESTCDLRISPR